MARAALFLASVCGWTLWRSARSPQPRHSRELLISNLLVEGLTLLMGLKLAWIMAIEPLRLNAGAL